MRISLIIIILTIISSMNDNEFKLKSGSKEFLGTLQFLDNYCFYLDVKSGQNLDLIFMTSSTFTKSPHIYVTFYIKDYTDYNSDNTEEYYLNVNGSNVSTTIKVDYAKNSKYLESNLITHIVISFMPSDTMYNTSVLATVTGIPYEDSIKTEIPIAIIILITIITCIVLLKCCCCKRPFSNVYYQKHTVQPLYQVNQPNQQPLGYATP